MSLLKIKKIYLIYVFILTFSSFTCFELKAGGQTLPGTLQTIALNNVNGEPVLVVQGQGEYSGPFTSVDVRIAPSNLSSHGQFTSSLTTTPVGNGIFIVDLSDQTLYEGYYLVKVVGTCSKGDNDSGSDDDSGSNTFTPAYALIYYKQQN